MDWNNGITVSFSILFLKLCFYFMDIGVLPACMCGDARSPVTGVTDSCGLSCGCWRLNPYPVEEESVLLTAESCFQSLPYFLIKIL